MACKYVKEFEFGPSKVPVKAYMRGGAVRKTASKAEGGAKESKSMMKKGIANQSPWLCNQYARV